MRAAAPKFYTHIHKFQSLMFIMISALIDLIKLMYVPLASLIRDA